MIHCYILISLYAFMNSCLSGVFFFPTPELVSVHKTDRPRLVGRLVCLLLSQLQSDEDRQDGYLGDLGDGHLQGFVQEALSALPCFPNKQGEVLAWGQLAGPFASLNLGGDFILKHGFFASSVSQNHFSQNIYSILQYLAYDPQNVQMDQCKK